MRSVSRAAFQRSIASWGLVALTLVARFGLRPAAEHLTIDANGFGWVKIPAGQFEMGCTTGDAGCAAAELPRHAVRITRPFSLMATPVTLAKYRESGLPVPDQPAWNTEANRPVVNVTWHEATRFCEAMGGRLPTEAEWEYAARGGRGDWRYPWGNEASHEQANYKGTGGRDQWPNTSPVGTFPANGYGLYDMSGNVWQWVADWYDPGYYGRSPATDPPGASAAEAAQAAARLAARSKERGTASQDEKEPSGEGTSREFRAMRGGSWLDESEKVRVSARSRNDPGHRHDRIGFRCARDGSS